MICIDWSVSIGILMIVFLCHLPNSAGSYNTIIQVKTTWQASKLVGTSEYLQYVPGSWSLPIKQMFREAVFFYNQTQCYTEPCI